MEPGLAPIPAEEPYRSIRPPRRSRRWTAARAALRPVAHQPATTEDLPRQPAGLLVLLDLRRPLRRHAVRGVPGERQAVPGEAMRAGITSFPSSSPIPRRPSAAISRRRPIIATPISSASSARRAASSFGRRSAIPTTRSIATCRRPPPRPRHGSLRTSNARRRRRRSAEPVPRSRVELAGHRRPGPRRRRPADLRFPHLRAVRAHADDHLLDRRRRGWSGSGLFRRLDRPHLPTGHRDLDEHPVALPPDHHRRRHRAELLDPARHPAPVLLDGAGGRGAGGVPAARATSNMCAQRGRSG